MYKLKIQDAKSIRLLKNTILTFAVKAGGTVLSFFMLPAYMRFFEDSNILGLWFTAISILSWFLVFDLGIGNGLRNLLVQSFAEKNDYDGKRYVSSAYIIVACFVLSLSIIGYITFAYINWNSILNVPQKKVSPLVLLFTVRIIYLGIMLQFLLRLISSILLAMQKPALPGFTALMSNLFLLGGLLFMNSSSVQQNLVKVSLANFITSVIPLVLLTAIVFTTTLKGYLPRLNFFSKQHARNIVKLGGVFFWIQIMYLVISNTNEFLINSLIGSSFVVEYKVYNSLFGFISVGFMLALGPVWSEVTGAFAKSDFVWIKSLYSKFIKLGVLSVVFVVILVFSMQFIVNIWLHHRAILIKNSYSIIFAVSTIITIWSSVLSSFINGMGKLKVQFISLTIGAVLNIVTSILFARLLGSWISIVVANIISLLPYCIWQSFWLHRYFDLKTKNVETISASI